MHKKVMALLAICTIFTLSKADEINIQILNTDAVTPAHIQELNTVFMDAICQTFFSINHISLMTRKINPISPQFYESLGFKQTDFYLSKYKDYENLQGFEWRK